MPAILRPAPAAASGAGGSFRAPVPTPPVLAPPVLLDLPGPSRRVRVEPLELPLPARAPEPAREPERTPEPAPEPARAPDRDPVPA